MGKKNSTFKNIMVTVGCAAAAGVYAVGGGYVVNTLFDGAGSARPAWLDRVEIRVDERASDSAVAQSAVQGSVTTGTAGAGGSTNTQTGYNPDGGDGSGNFNSGGASQKPRFDEKEDETET